MYEAKNVRKHRTQLLGRSDSYSEPVLCQLWFSFEWRYEFNSVCLSAHRTLVVCCYCIFCKAYRNNLLYDMSNSIVVSCYHICIPFSWWDEDEGKRYYFYVLMGAYFIVTGSARSLMSNEYRYYAMYEDNRKIIDIRQWKSNHQ